MSNCLLLTILNGKIIKVLTEINRDKIYFIGNRLLFNAWASEIGGKGFEGKSLSSIMSEDGMCLLHISRSLVLAG